ncbi:MAG: CDP-alcohol phosphatidyltransferase family protein [Chakrabartia sp.]
MTPPVKRGISLRAVAPNAVTALALCFGLTGIRFAISAVGATPNPGDWERAIGAIVIAAVLDGLDGRIARLLKGESRFGAELDSLSDVIAFGVSPAIILYLWSLQNMPHFGWTCALAYGVCCALRLARFNAAIDAEDQPHKSAGFLTGIPAPAGAGIAFVPLYLWIVTGNDLFRNPVIVAPWIVFVAALMISNVATYSWSSIRLRRHVRLEAILLVALLGAALFSEPWITLIVVSLGYLAMIPFSLRSYARVKRGVQSR